MFSLGAALLQFITQCNSVESVHALVRAMEICTILGFVYGTNGLLSRFVMRELLQAHQAATQEGLELRSCKEMLELCEAMGHLQQIEMYVDKYAVEPLEPLLVSGRKRLHTDIELKQATAPAGAMRSQLLQLSEPTTEVPSVDAYHANGVPSTLFAQRNAAIGFPKHKKQKTETTMGCAARAPLPYEHLSTFPRPGLKESKIFIPDLLRPYVSLTRPEAGSKRLNDDTQDSNEDTTALDSLRDAVSRIETIQERTQAAALRLRGRGQEDCTTKAEDVEAHDFEAETGTATQGVEAAAGSAAAAAEGDTKDLNEDTNASSSLHQDCMTPAEDCEAETASRDTELEALAMHPESQDLATARGMDLFFRPQGRGANAELLPAAARCGGNPATAAITRAGTQSLLQEQQLRLADSEAGFCHCGPVAVDSPVPSSVPESAAETDDS